MKTVYPLVRFALAFILGLVLGRGFDLPGSAGGLLAGAGLFVSLIYLSFRKRVSPFLRPALLWTGVFLLAAGLGVWRYSLAGRVPERDVSRYASEVPRPVTGTVAAVPDFRRHSVRFVLDCRRLGTEEGEVPVTGRLQVTFHGQVREAEEILKLGSLVRVTAKVRLPPEATNPGEVSPRARLAQRSIHAETRIYSSDHLELLTEPRGFSPARLALVLKRRLAGVLRYSLPDRYGHPGGLESVILEAVMLGERGAVPFEIRDRFRTVGVIHVLVVSGLHVGFIWLIGSFLFSPFPPRVRHALLIPTVAVYVLLTGAGTPAVRAGVMGGVYSLAFVFNQPRNPQTALAAAALFLLLINPLVLFTAGFQLSFLIVLSIVTVTPFLERLLKFLPRWLRLTVSVPLAAQLGAVPLVAYHFGFVSLPALPANIVVVPLAGAMVGLGFAAGLLGLIAPTLAWLVNYPNRTLIPLLLRIVGWFSRIPGGNLRVAGFPALYVPVYYAVLFGAVSLPCRGRRGRVVLAAAMATLLLAAFASSLLPREPLPPLSAVFFNGRSGQMILLRERDGPVILISTDDDRFGDIPAIVIPYLDREGIGKIDYLVLTQVSLARLDTLHRLREAVRVGTVLDHPLGPSSPAYPRFREVLAEAGIGYRRLTAGDRFQAGGVRMDTLWPSRPPGTPFEIDDSLVLRAEFGEISFLFPSLIGIFAQEDLVSAVGEGLRSTVLMAPRRGSAAHNSPFFLEAVSPAAVLIVQGQKYFGRHPRDCGEFLEERGTEVYRSGEEGCLTVETDGEEFRVLSHLLEREEELP